MAPAAHPLAHVVPMSSHNCKNCGFIPPYMEVIAATYAMSPASGDEA